MLNIEVFWDMTPLRLLYKIEQNAYEDISVFDTSTIASDIL